MAEDESKFPIEQLLSLAGNSNYLNDPVITSRYLGLANAKLGIESNELSMHNQLLTEKLLISNQQASEQNEKNAELMNKATVQLANSTASLNRATWVLVGFTAVQAIIALITLFKK